MVRGDRVREVLEYVDYKEDELLRQLRGHVEDALDAGRLTCEESALFWERYETALEGYTGWGRARRSPPTSPPRAERARHDARRHGGPHPAMNRTTKS